MATSPVKHVVRLQAAPSERDLAERVRRLELEVAELRARRRPLDPRDELLLARLLPAIAEAFPDREFCVCELMAVEVVRAAIAGRSSRSLGRLFERLDRLGLEVGGFRIICIGSGRSGRLWKLATLATALP